MGTSKNCKSPKLYTKKADPETGVTPTMATPSLGFSGFQCVVETLHWLVSLSFILLMDVFSKKAFEVASIEISGALFGMLCVFMVMMILHCAVPSAVTVLVYFFEPGLMFIHRWPPLFYAPYLVVLPLSIKDIPPSSATKAYFILVGACLSTLYVTGYTAILAREAIETEVVDDKPMVKPSPFSTELKEKPSTFSAETMEKPKPSTFSVEPMEKPSTFSSIEVLAWTWVLLISFVASLFYPTALGTRARTCLPFLLASTVLGYMVGSRLPSNVKKVFHPIIFSAASAILTAYAFGYFSKSGLDPVLGYYLTRSLSNPGAGDILVGFLGSFIITLPFSMFKRKLVEGHGPELLISVIISPVFLLSSTTVVGLVVILEPSLTVSILPKCITVALALTIVSLFEGGNSSLAEAVFVVIGLLGANYVQSTFPDSIIQRIATASSGNVLGTAALSAREPKPFPYWPLLRIFG